MEALLWIRIGLNADPDPAFSLHAVPDPGQTLKSQKVDFDHVIVHKYVIDQKTFLLRRYKNHFLKGRKPGVFVNFYQLHASGSGSRTSKSMRSLADPAGSSTLHGGQWTFAMEAVEP